jgi:hypothetical protein
VITANSGNAGTVWNSFPFWHLADVDNDILSISSNIINHICDQLKTDITLPFPSALHVVHINAEDLICHFGDVHELFFASNIHVILIS